MMKAAQVLDAIEHKHRQKGALVRELSVADELELALYRRWYIGAYPRWADSMASRWEELGLPIAPAGSVPEGYVPHSTPKTRRIDGLLLESQKFTAIEVKVSRADFLRETEEKRRMWRSITSRFVYATPTGLLNVEEIPDGCGLWEVNERGDVLVAKRAKVNASPNPLPAQTWRAVFYRLASSEQALRPRG